MTYIKDMIPEAEVEFRLDTKIIDPPILKLKVKPLDFLIMADIVAEEKMMPKYSRVLIEEVLNCIVDWELTKKDGEKIPVTDENKKLYLGRLLREPTVSEKGEYETMLIYAIRNFAEKAENFLKN
jgi:hypothetical protein